MPGRGKLLFCVYLALSCAAVFATPPGSEKINYADYFTAPAVDKDIIFVFYNNFIDRSDQSQYTYALLYGLEYAFTSSLPGNHLSVGVYFSDGKGRICLVPKSIYSSYRNKAITLDELFKHITVRDGKL